MQTKIKIIHKNNKITVLDARKQMQADSKQAMNQEKEPEKEAKTD